MMRDVLEHPATKIAALVVALLAVAGIAYKLFAPADKKTAVAYFPAAIHLYPGSDVDVLGVKIGTIDSVTPQGTKVRVELSYDAERKIPADAVAIAMEPTLVADRVVELSPAYGGGPTLADGATIPLERTRVPLELDQMTTNLVELAKALGPDGANGSGALARAISVGADNLRGVGGRAHTTLTRMADLMNTLGDNRQSLYGTVRNLQQFVATLASHDQETRAFTTDLAGVSRQLADESAAFSAALHHLGVALDDVTHFVRDNREELAKDVDGLAKVSNVLARERVLLARIIDMGAVGISNYPHMYTPSARTYNARFANVYTDNPALWFCQLYGSIGGDAKQCIETLSPLKDIPLPKSRGAE